MSTQELLTLPVSNLAAPDCFLFLWATNAMLPEALQVMAAWNFTYKGLAHWIKDRPGMGHYFRNWSEQLLLGVHGKPKFRNHNQPNFLFAPRLEHSRKPEEYYSIIERCCEGPYLELFARTERSGWDSTGFEVDGRDIREVVCR